MQRARTEYDLLGDKNDEVAELIENPKWRASKAVSMLLTGTIVAAVCSDPLVDAVDNFSTASNIPSLFVAFIILPFATSSEAVSALIFASRKRSRTSSLTYSAVCIFCAWLVNLRLLIELPWCYWHLTTCKSLVRNCRYMDRWPWVTFFHCQSSWVLFTFAIWHGTFQQKCR